jgi:hypothetical protein
MTNMNRIRSLLTLGSLAVLTVAASPAHAAPSTYTFNTNVAINPDGGVFWSVSDDSKSHPQGTLLLEFDYDSVTNTGSVHTDRNLTSLFFDTSCTSADNGAGCVRYKIDADASTSVKKTPDGMYYQITFYMTGDSIHTVNYWVQLLIGEARYLGASNGGTTLSGIYHSDSHNSAWFGASGKLCQSSGCS